MMLKIVIVAEDPLLVCKKLKSRREVSFHQTLDAIERFARHVIVTFSLSDMEMLLLG